MLIERESEWLVKIMKYKNQMVIKITQEIVILYYN